MNTTSKLMFTGLALALAFAASVQAAGPGIDDRSLAEAADRAELGEIAVRLADRDDPERFSAVHALVNLASRHVGLPREISDLLEVAARDSDPEIARFASNALYQLEMGALLAEVPPETRTDAVLWEIANQRQLEEIGTILNDPRSPERYGAAHGLANLASSYDVLPREVLDLLKRTREDDDFEIARLAEIVLAKREGRPIDPFFLSEPVAQVDVPAAQKRGDDPFEKLSHPNPTMRYDALAHLLEVAPKDGRTIDPEVLKAFTKARFDPDPRVRSFAEFAVGGGLAGDENALRQVYVGNVQPMTGIAYTLQQPAPEKAPGALQHEGTLDEHGVFIGVTKASEGDSLQQPIPAPEYAEAKQHPGSMDEHCVFIGVVVPSNGAEHRTEEVNKD